MAYKAIAIEVMIASPGDVTTEREIVRGLLSEWNHIHSRAQKAVLLPSGWDTHSAPDLGGRAQQMINDRILAHADLLVGIFWTRIGTPTGDAKSGTVEEIQEHHAAGKPVMLYFSQTPVVPGSYDEAQFAEVQAFKDWARAQGLIAVFDNATDFTGKFRRELQINLRDNPYLQDLLGQADTGTEAVPAGTQRITLKEEAVALLRAGATANNGMIMTLRTMDGYHVQAGNESLFDGQNPREEAKWRAAVNQLEDYGLTQDVNGKGEIFRLTDQGYEAAEKLPEADPEMPKDS
jgi:hypothetical protein